MKNLFIKSEVGKIVVDYVQQHGYEISKAGIPQIHRMLIKDKQGNMYQAKLSIEEWKGKENEC